MIFAASSRVLFLSHNEKFILFFKKVNMFFISFLVFYTVVFLVINVIVMK